MLLKRKRLIPKNYLEVTLESKIQAKIIKQLKSDGYLVVKTIMLNESGYPDIFAFKNGKTLFVEVKSEKGKLSELQKYRIEQLQKQCFEVIVARSLDDIKKATD